MLPTEILLNALTRMRAFLCSFMSAVNVWNMWPENLERVCIWMAVNVNKWANFSTHHFVTNWILFVDVMTKYVWGTCNMGADGAGEHLDSFFEGSGCRSSRNLT